MLLLLLLLFLFPFFCVFFKKDAKMEADVDGCRSDRAGSGGRKNTVTSGTA